MIWWYMQGLASARAVAAAVYTLGFQTLHPTGSQQLEGTGIDSVSGVSLSRANEEHILVHRGFAASSCIRLLGKCVGVFVNIFANADAVRQVLSVESGSQQKRGWSSANSVVPWEEVLFPLSTPVRVFFVDSAIVYCLLCFLSHNVSSCVVLFE